jgi:LPS-assembly protein
MSHYVICFGRIAYMGYKLSARKRAWGVYFIIGLLFLSLVGMSSPSTSNNTAFSTLTSDAIGRQLGWIPSDDNQCHGYYLEGPFTYPVNIENKAALEITSEQGFYTQRGTSILEKNVTANRAQQQITADKVFLHRDMKTGKLTTMDMLGNVHLREPNTLIIGEEGHYEFGTESKSMTHLYYRTSLGIGKKVIGPKIPLQDTQHERKIIETTAWGKATEFESTEPLVYDLYQSSFTTCPPINPSWQIKASHIELNKNSGRGYATHARFLIKDVPVFYIPYFNFSIDKQRKSGFLWPTIGFTSNKWGPYLLTPFYWNMAPNYDMVITPGLLTKRGVQLSDTFRYLSTVNAGKLNLTVLPGDRAFRKFQQDLRDDPANANAPFGQPASITEAETNRLLDASTTRTGFSWLDNSRFNQYWSSHVDFSYASDDYYLRDFGRNLSDITQNQLAQEADLFFSSPHWNFTARLQAYQTLHPVEENFVLNQYRRLPQLTLTADYPDQILGLEFFMSSDLTHFDILKNPGVPMSSPVGNRLHFQPGISLPLYWPYFYIAPRIQVALTQYNLQQTTGTTTPNLPQPTDTKTPNAIHRSLPIFDLASGLSFTRNINLFSYFFQQTLEPQAYYTYIPYRNQNAIPNFDTTVNMLAYDQIFNYNRFTGIDRIGDANQIGMGVTTRLIDVETGLEKVRFGVGGIVYFANRRVTLCQNDSCTNNPENPANRRRLSPLSGLLNLMISPQWTFTSNLIWNTTSRLVDNATLAFHYQPGLQKIINLGYTYARNYDIVSGIVVNTGKNNLKITDISLAWPLFYGISTMGRWSQDWNGNHFQNLLFGLQYDTCCWAVRLVGGKAFTNLEENKPKYNSQFFIQFDLKGLGNVGSDPSKLLSSIAGYNTQFGQEL